MPYAKLSWNEDKTEHVPDTTLFIFPKRGACLGPQCGIEAVLVKSKFSTWSPEPWAKQTVLYLHVFLHQQLVTLMKALSASQSLSFSCAVSLPPTRMSERSDPWRCVDVPTLCLLSACPKVMDETNGEQTHSVCCSSLSKRRDCEGELFAPEE